MSDSQVVLRNLVTRIGQFKELIFTGKSLRLEANTGGIYPLKSCTATFGRLLLEFELETKWIDLRAYKEIEILVRNQDSIIADGKWIIPEPNRVQDEFYLEMIRPNIEILDCSRDRIASDVLLRNSYYKLLLNLDNDIKNSFNWHFSELKECPIRIPVSLVHDNGVFEGTFDFNSNSKNLEVIRLSFNRNSIESILNLSKKLSISIRYNFVGVHYIFSSFLLGVDLDFNLVSIVVPKGLIAISRRQFERYQAFYKVEIFSLRSDLSIVGNLISVSVLGASIRIDSNSKFELDDEVELVCDSYRVRSRIIRLSKNDIILEFEKSVAGSLESRNFLIKALPSNIKIRQKDLYEQLLLLYQEVGYAPLTGDKYSSWKEESIHAWSLQDSVLHGNCTLGVINTSAQASLGTLPLSSRVIYGHSLCMVKTLEAANSLFEQLTYSLSWVNFLPDIQYYSGSYRKNSGFTTKLQTMYDLCGSPIDQIVVHTNQVISPSEEIKLDFQHFILESIQKTHDLKFSFPDRLKKTIELLETPHSSISNIHNIVKYVIRSSDENVPVAILLLSSAPKKFTAADIFRYIWLFKFESISKTEDIVKWILSQSEFRDFPIQLVDSESLQKSPEYNGPFKTVPAFWTFTPKDEIGTQISTMARAVYTILKKYGQSASDSLMRLC